MHILPILKRGAFICLVFLLGLAVVPIQARAGSMPRPQMLKVGPYSVQVTLSPDPPEVEKPLNVTLVADNASHLSGSIQAVPGPGTDAIPVRPPLTPVGHAWNTLEGTLHLPVRGPCQFII